MNKKVIYDDSELNNLNKPVLKDNENKITKFFQQSKQFFMIIFFWSVKLILIIIILVLFKNSHFLNITENGKSNTFSFAHEIFSKKKDERYDEFGKRIYSKTGTLSFNYFLS